MLQMPKRLCAIAFALGLASCGGFAASPGTHGLSSSMTLSKSTTPPARNYLYIDEISALHKGLVERYLLHDGIPEKSPGFTIQLSSQYGYDDQHIAVAGDGTLFVMGFGYDPIQVYEFGKHTPERTITIPTGACGRNPMAVSAIAADQQGYAFVQFTSYATDGKPVGPSAAPQRGGCSGVWVFAPGASGKAEPILTIPLPLDTYASSLSVDSADNLYVALGGSVVLEFANATTQPVETRDFHGSVDLRPLAATDASGDAFIVTTKTQYGTEHINRFTATGNPHDGPVNSIDVDTPNPHFPISMTALARHVYIVNDYAEGVEMYHAYKRGPQTPFDFVKATNVRSIAVGP